MSWNARAGGQFIVPTVIRNWLRWFGGFQGVKNYSHSVDPNYPARISRDHLTLDRPSVYQREPNTQRTRPHSVMGIQASEKPYPPQLFSFRHRQLPAPETLRGGLTSVSSDSSYVVKQLHQTLGHSGLKHFLVVVSLTV